MTARPVIISASLLAALVAGLAWSTKDRELPAASEATTARAMPTIAPSGALTNSRPMVRGTVARVTSERARIELSPGLSPDGAALLSEQTVVRQLVKESEVALTSAQWAELAALTWQYQAVRQTFEATIATVSAQDPQRLEIPAYPAAGDALRERFYGELRERLGAEAAEAIASRAGTALEGYFGGFGVSVQTLDFGPGAGAPSQVTRTAHYWNSTDSRDALTLRRETHFPQLEDPTGERWGPFLTLLATRTGEKAGS
ncbi:MAG: hypothetical protein NTV51_03245 [Verrucomicrobia bacterium]|nr:hypothetical protein [Verrucomicrobiota bacterium]